MAVKVGKLRGEKYFKVSVGRLRIEGLPTRSVNTGGEDDDEFFVASKVGSVSLNGPGVERNSVRRGGGEGTIVVIWAEQRNQSLEEFLEQRWLRMRGEAWGV